LDKELAFFKSSSVAAISARDQAAYAAKQATAELEVTAAKLKDAQAAASHAHSQLCSQQQAAAELRARLDDAEQQLQGQQRELHELQQAHAALQRRSAQAAEQLQAELSRAQVRRAGLVVVRKLVWVCGCVMWHCVVCCCPPTQVAKVQLAADLTTARATAGVLEAELQDLKAVLQDSKAQAAAAQEQAKQLKQANGELHVGLQRRGRSCCISVLRLAQAAMLRLHHPTIPPTH
jgi:chromosome segregation ATPase